MNNISQIYGWQILATYKMIVLLYGFLIFFSCDEVNKMTQSVLLLCQNLVNKTRPKSEIKRALKLFCCHIVQEKPQIRCPLGLPINRGSFFNILKDVINYLIIVFQLDT
ncbi:hypothetical protein MTP99_011838 [Tenebrio molitor]|nr:hypothetical protein MTP99_011838 [Tenebrio molitor]